MTVSDDKSTHIAYGLCEKNSPCWFQRVAVQLGQTTPSRVKTRARHAVLRV